VNRYGVQSAYVKRYKVQMEQSWMQKDLLNMSVLQTVCALNAGSSKALYNKNSAVPKPLSAACSVIL